MPGGPLIGITVSRRRTDTYIGRVTFDGTSAAYVDSVRDAGGIPVLLPASVGPEGVDRLLDRLDGVVLTGGGDVDPALYGEPRDEKTGGINRVRDDFELEILRVACERQFPVLAICRGLQLLGVLYGGTLTQHLPEHPTAMDVEVAHEGLHPIRIEPDSALGRVTGSTGFGVNSLHHQAVEQAPDPLRVTARAEDGVIEGLEIVGRDHLLGVQWHPEHMTHTAENAALFGWLVKRASG